MNLQNKSRKPVLLIILDGWGHRLETKDNAVAASNKPFFDKLWAEYPHSLLKASGDAVGLPEGQMGNSEVGHMTIGAGAPIDTDLVRVDKAIRAGEFDRNPAFLALFQHVKEHCSTLHVQGLLSDGGVHSHMEHLFAFLRLAKKEGVPRVAVHVFTDGRDTPPQSASTYLKQLEVLIDELNDSGKPRFSIATVSGRYYAMDRDNNWNRLSKVEQALFECKGAICNIKPSLYLSERYKQGDKDELLEPIVITTPDGADLSIKNDDGVFFFNFRADRARMISEKLIAKAKKENIHFLTLTEYHPDFDCPTAFTPKTVEATLGEALSQAGMKQSRIAETEKFPHATYFLNGGKDQPYEGQTNIMLASRKDVKTHDEAPEMRAEAIADKAIEEIGSGVPSFIFINFANPDMVGHTANVPAIIRAIEVVDIQLKRVIEALDKAGGVAIVTADHGNAEINVDPETGEKHTAHTLSLVPCIITDKGYVLKDGGLADLAPTALDLLGIKKPVGMTGRSLIQNRPI